MEYNVGKIFTGTVIQAYDGEYLIDIGIGIDAILPEEEATSELYSNDEVIVIVTHYKRDDLFVSQKGVEERKNKELLENAIVTKELVSGVVVDYYKNFFKVIVNDVECQVYVKNMDAVFVRDTNKYIGQTYNFVVTKKLSKKFGNFELSRREIANNELEIVKDVFEEKYIISNKYSGVVKSKIDHGLIVLVDTYDCFVPNREVSFYKDKVYNVGDHVEVVLIEKDRSRLRLVGSLKQSEVNPWDLASELKIKKEMTGIITRKESYGLFVEVIKGIEGLIHISEISHEKVNSLNNFKIGDSISYVIKEIDVKARKISLSHKFLIPSPFALLKNSLGEGDKLKVKIVKMLRTGVVVEVKPGINLFMVNEDIHDFSKVRPMMKPNDIIDVIVLTIDEEKEEIVLSNEEFQKRANAEFLNYMEDLNE